MSASDSDQGWPSEELRKFEQRLRAERDRLLTEVDRETEGIREDLNPSGNNSVPIHLGDAAPSQLDADITVMEFERLLLVMTQQALDRIEEGTFGKCIHCGKKIRRDRLRELPFTPFCIKCAEKAERGEIPSPTSEMEATAPTRPVSFPGEAAEDRYAAGSPGGGMAAGGLAGTNEPDGSASEEVALQEAFGSGLADRDDTEEQD